MKKKVIYIFLVILLIVGIITGFVKFYESTSYYVWSKDAINSSILRIKGSFLLNDNYRRITASGEIINCTDEEIIINPNSIILYCQNKNTNELFSFTNNKSYNLIPDRKTGIEIPIYDGSEILNGPDEAKRIYKNYQIVKIEYKDFENNINILKTVEETGSKFVPLGICISVPILLALIIVIAIFVLQCNKQNCFNLLQVLKNISTKTRISMLFLLFTIPFSLIIPGLFAFRDSHWNLVTFCSISAISSLIIIILIMSISLLIVKCVRKKKLVEILTNRITVLNSEIIPIEKPYADKIQELNSLIDNKELQIRNHKITINKNNNNDNRVISEISYIDSLSGLQFEEYCVKMFNSLGYSAIKTKGSGDFGADLILNHSISVQCKLYKSPVGLHALQEVYSSMARYKTNSAWVITNSTFTRQAVEYAKDAKIRLIDRESLKQLTRDAFNVQSSAKISVLRNTINILERQISELETEIDDICCNKIPQAKLLRENLCKLKADVNSIDALNYKQIRTLYKNYIKIN